MIYIYYNILTYQIVESWMRGVGFRGWVHILASGHAMIGGLVASHTHTAEKIPWD